MQVPGYLQHEASLKELGVDEVIVYCVNDAAVMEAWAQDQGIGGSMVTFLGDPTSTLTKVGPIIVLYVTNMRANSCAYVVLMFC